MLPSKIFKSYMLNWLATEVHCEDSQYGGIKGCSVAHHLMDLWDETGWNLEDDRAACHLTRIDYAKAFNRMSFQHCLRAFARKGASTQTIALLATFLSNRTMSVKVAETFSDPQTVFGGVPQGSILRVLHFQRNCQEPQMGPRYSRGRWGPFVRGTLVSRQGQMRAPFGRDRATIHIKEENGREFDEGWQDEGWHEVLYFPDERLPFTSSRTTTEVKQR